MDFCHFILPVFVVAGGLAIDIDRAAARLKISVLTYGHLPGGSRIASTAMIRYKEIAFVAYPD